MLIASALTATLICLPFFAMAPRAMWNQIVRDQAFRRAGGDVALIWRLDEIVGLGIVGRPHLTITVLAMFALLCCAALAWSHREARLAVLLFLGQAAFLLATPTWFPHYAGFTAAPVALVVGAAIGRVIAWHVSDRRGSRSVSLPQGRLWCTRVAGPTSPSAGSSPATSEASPPRRRAA